MFAVVKKQTRCNYRFCHIALLFSLQISYWFYDLDELLKAVLEIWPIINVECDTIQIVKNIFMKHYLLYVIHFNFFITPLSFMKLAKT